MSIKRILYAVVQLTWGLLQTAVGFVLFCINRKEEHFFFHGAIVCHWNEPSCISLGLFIFMYKQPHAIRIGAEVIPASEAKQRVLVHEYGHTIQSLLLGPLYLPLVGLPSILWARIPALRKMRKNKRISYYSVYPENWANLLGEKVIKEPSPKCSLPA